MKKKRFVNLIAPMAHEHLHRVGGYAKHRDQDDASRQAKSIGVAQRGQQRRQKPAIQIRHEMRVCQSPQLEIGGEMSTKTHCLFYVKQIRIKTGILHTKEGKVKPGLLIRPIRPITVETISPPIRWSRRPGAGRTRPRSCRRAEAPAGGGG